MKYHFSYENIEKMRLDIFLSNKKNLFTREKIKIFIKNGNVSVNNIVIIKPSFILQKNDLIEIDVVENYEENFVLKPWFSEEMPKIIFECDDYLIINKPSGLTIHPGNGNLNNTLVNILISKYKSLSMITTNRPGIVHRIDKNTSGVLIIAKNDKFHEYITEQFSKHNIKKKYELITDGKYKTIKGIIDAPIGRNPNNRKLMMVTKTNSKFAKSTFRVIESFKNNEYVEFEILTGRTHQIRVHSKFIGAPILNDSEYGNSIKNDNFGQYLHAKKISFVDRKNNVVHYEAELPFEMIKKLEELRGIK